MCLREAVEGQYGVTRPTALGRPARWPIVGGGGHGGAAWTTLWTERHLRHSGGKLYAGTDYGVLVGTLDANGDVTAWNRVGGQSGSPTALPLTTVFDLHIGPDGFLYAATHGRGIWKIHL
jgi:hypothetical protein